MATKKKAAKSAEKLNPVKLVRDAWLAGLGSYVKAYEVAVEGYGEAKERAQDLRGRLDGLKDRAQELVARRDALIKELIGKGEDIEALAEKNIADARSNVVKFAEPRIEKIRGLIPTTGGDDKAAELEAEIEKLNKKIATLTKKAAPAKAPAKAAAKKPATRKPAAVKAPAKAVAPKKAVEPKAAEPKAPAAETSKAA